MSCLCIYLTFYPRQESLPGRRRLPIKSRIEGVEIAAVQVILHVTEGFAEPLEVNYLPFPKEADGIADILVLHHAEDVVVGDAGFLFCRQILKKIRNRIPFGLEFAGIKGDAACRLGPDSQCMVYIVLVKAAFFNLFHAQVAGELEHDGADDLQMSQFLGAYIVHRNVPNEALCGQARCFRLICT